MKAKSIISTSMIVVGVGFIILVIIFFMNSSSAKCNPAHQFDSTSNYCFYTPTILPCATSEKSTIVDGKLMCFYEKKGFIDKDNMFTLLVSTVILFIILLIVYVILSTKTDRETLDMDVAIDNWCRWYSNHYNIGKLGDEYDKQSFSVLPHRFKTLKNGDMYGRFSVQVKAGAAPGVYTCEVNLNKDIQNILNGNVDYTCTAPSNYRRPKDYSLSSDAKERALDKLEETDSEKAQEIREKMILGEAAGASAEVNPPTNLPYSANYYQKSRKKRKWFNRGGY